MDKKDLLTFVTAILFVLGIALVTHPPEFGSSGAETTQGLDQKGAISGYCTDSSCCSDKVQYTYITERIDPPFIIQYNNDLSTIYAPGAQGYPRLHLPGNVYVPVGNFYVPSTYGSGQATDMDTYVSSDLFSPDIWGDSGDFQTFAYMKGNKSGYSKIFGVPYSLWRINCTMKPDGNPAYSRLMWVLVDSATGDVITGGNIFPQGEILKEVTVYDKKMYFIIQAENVLSFSIELQTPIVTYNNIYPKPAESKLVDFLNTMGN
ncbi:MAG: hypothetical protein JW931_04110 [Methanomicrobiaceae archaeon]|nr:hypothetical protein [Methanomicrobiaceae archaeon]